MLKSLLAKFDSSNSEFKKAENLANEIDKLDDTMQSYSDIELQAKFEEFKQRFIAGESLDELLVESFAVVREASFRVLAMKPFFVQLIGGIVLHYGNIAEMKTGEGKTLTSVLPAYLNAISGKGVHIITVNDYLATREAQGEIGKLFEWLGLSVGLNVRDLSANDKREVYKCDIVYTTNNELGFDYLRDNMVLYSDNRVQQRGLNYAIIDEVDSILIDEARTPLIISGGKNQTDSIYTQSDTIAKNLKVDTDFVLDIKTKSVSLTQNGIKRCEVFFGVENLYDLEHAGFVHNLHQALKANYTLDNEVDYIIQDGEIVIVDQFTGRLMPGRAFSDGLHQAIEAKEGVNIKDETRTMATITFQNLFRMYSKLSGMTGTAKTEEEEFRDIYNMYVVAIPTNMPIVRKDLVDKVFSTMRGKYTCLVRDVKEIYETKQPILIGTVAVETSEVISKLLSKAGIKHEVLNAKNHFREAEIIANAGNQGSVTIATNMAGRGTDIRLGEGVCDLGGLYVIGTERHESRRIDNQLRGRSGRQGDAGKSQFYVSFEDTLMLRFGSQNAQRLQKVGIAEDEPIQMKMFSKSIESAQSRIEGNNYDMRKRVLQFDEVMSSQRKIMYQLRNEIIDLDSYHEKILILIKNVVNQYVKNTIISSDCFNENVVNQVIDYVNSHYLNEDELINKIEYTDEESFINNLSDTIISSYENKLDLIEDDERKKEFEKIIALRVFDTHWVKQIDTMDHLKEGIGLRSYAQQNPLHEYTLEGKRLFDSMMYNIEKDIVQFCLKSQVRINSKREEVIKGKAVRDASKENVKKKPLTKNKIKVNKPCPCGSGKKYKHCCGKI
ncbi:MAG: preprotein translocase subunit SecA [Bacilli bacterium]